MNLRALRDTLLSRDCIPLAAFAAAIVFIQFPWHASLWLDETVTAWVIHADLKDVDIRANAFQGQSPLYFALLWGWTRLTGSSSEWMLRLPSLVFAFGSLALIFRIARRFVDPAGAALSVILTVAMDGFVRGGVIARPYSPALFFALLFLLLLMRWVEQPGRLRFLGLGAAILVAFYLHYFFAGIAVAGALYAKLFWTPGRRIRPSTAVHCGVTFILLLLPGLVHLVELRNRTALYTVDKIPGVLDALKLIVPPSVLLLAALSVVIPRIFIPFRVNKDGSDTRRKIIFLAVWSVLPVAVFYIASLGVGRLLLVGRYTSWSIPGAAILIAYLLSKLEPPEFRRAAAGIMVLLMLLAPRRWQIEDWRGAADFTRAEIARSPDTGVLLYTGFVEMERIGFLKSPLNNGYLQCPFAIYPIPAELFFLPSGLETEPHRVYGEKTVLPYIAEHGEALLIAPNVTQFEGGGEKVPDYYERYFSARGYVVERALDQGLIKILRVRCTPSVAACARPHAGKDLPAENPAPVN